MKQFNILCKKHSTKVLLLTPVILMAGFLIYAWFHPIPEDRIHLIEDKGVFKLEVDYWIIPPSEIEITDTNGDIVASDKIPAKVSSKSKELTFNQPFEEDAYILVFHTLGLKHQLNMEVTKTPTVAPREGELLEETISTVAKEQITLVYEINQLSRVRECKIYKYSPSTSESEQPITIQDHSSETGEVSFTLDKGGEYTFRMTCSFEDDTYATSDKLEITRASDESLAYLNYTETESIEDYGAFQDEEYPYTFKYPSNWLIESSAELGSVDDMTINQSEILTYHTYTSIFTNFGIEIVIRSFDYDKDCINEQKPYFYPYSADEFVELNSIDDIKLMRAKTYTTYRETDPDYSGEPGCSQESCVGYKIGTSPEKINSQEVNEFSYNTIVILGARNGEATDSLPIFGAGAEAGDGVNIYYFVPDIIDLAIPPDTLARRVELCDEVIKSLAVNEDFSEPF